AFFTHKLTWTHQSEYCLLALRRDDRELDLACLDKVDSVRIVSLRKELRALPTLQQSLAFDNVLKHVLGRQTGILGFESFCIPCSHNGYSTRSHCDKSRVSQETE